MSYWRYAYKRASTWAEEHEREAFRAQGEVAAHEANAAEYWREQAKRAAYYVQRERPEEGEI